VTQIRAYIVYAISSRALASAIARQALANKDVAVLVALSQVYLCVTGYYGLYVGAIANSVFILEAFIISSITAWGIWYCYRKNGADAGAGFAEKLLLFVLPIGWKIFLASRFLPKVLGFGTGAHSAKHVGIGVGTSFLCDGLHLVLSDGSPLLLTVRPLDELDTTSSWSLKPLLLLSKFLVRRSLSRRGSISRSPDPMQRCALRSVT